MVQTRETKRKKEPTNRLSKPEILEMEKIIMKGKQKILDEQFHKRLTDKFNKMPDRAGKPLQIKQVQNFFKKRKRALCRNIASSKTSEVITVTDTSISNNAANETSSDLLGVHSSQVKDLEKAERKPKRGRSSQAEELEKAESKPKRGRSSQAEELEETEIKPKRGRSSRAEELEKAESKPKRGRSSQAEELEKTESKAKRKRSSQAEELEKAESKPKRGRSTSCFTKSEVQKMEKIIEVGKQNILDEKFHKKLTNQFNKSPSRTGKALQVNQIQSFFEERNSAVIGAVDLTRSTGVVMIACTSDSNNADENSSGLHGVHSSQRKLVENSESKRRRLRSATKSEVNSENLPKEKHIEKTERLHNEGKHGVINEGCCKQPTEEIKDSRKQDGSKGAHLLQVQKGIENRKPLINLDPREPSNELVLTSEPSSPDKAALETNSSLLDAASETESSSSSEKDISENSEQEDMEFEAKSLRDNAWYDVATFLSHRVLSTGEAEVKVRFLGFDSDHDEWLNIKKYVRERSIPLEASDCKHVQVGDLVLCYQETSDHAMHFDAHVMEIEKVEHEEKSCKCRFLIRFDHDQTEEKVRLKRMCRRPPLIC